MIDDLREKCCADNIGRHVGVLCRSPSECIAVVLDAEELASRFGAAVFPLLHCSDDEESEIRLLNSSEITLAPFPGSTSAQDLSTQSLSELLEFSVRIAIERRRPSDPICVVWSSDGVTALLGAVHAIAARKLIVIADGLGNGLRVECTAPPRSVTFVLSSERLAALGWDYLGAQISSGKFGISPHRPWGVLTASTPDRLSNLLARIALRVPPSQPSAVSASTGPQRETPIAPDFRFLSLQRHPAELMNSLATLQPSFFHFVGHGRSYCAGSGNLCSLRSREEAGSTKCIGGYQCIFSQAPRTPASTIRTEFAMIESCCAASVQQIGPTQATGTNLATELLDGFAVAVLAPYRTNPSLPSMPLLALRLAQQGATVGEVLLVLNRHANRLLNNCTHFVLLGDPELHLFTRPFQSPAQATVVSEYQGLWKLRLPPQQRSIELFKCENSLLSDSARQGPIHCLDDTVSPLARYFEVVLPAGEEDRSLFLLVTDCTANGEHETFVELTSHSPFPKALLQVASHILEASRMDGSSPHSGRTAPPRAAVSLADLLQRTEVAVTPILTTAITSAPQYHELYALEKQVRSLCEAACLQLADALLDLGWAEGLWLFRYYANTRGIAFLETTLIESRCPRCNGSVQSRRYRVGLWPHRLRQLIECERCMFLSDTEMEACPIELEAPPRVTRGLDFVVKLRGRNHFPFSSLITSGLVVERLGSARELFEVTPRACQHWVEASAEFELSFIVRVDTRVPLHLFHAQAFVLVNGLPCWSMAKIQLTD